MEQLAECPAESDLAGRASVCEGCPGQALCQSQGRIDPDQEMIDIRMNVIKHKILVMSGKGGVGKSTVGCMLAQVLASQSCKVGVVDLDICGPSIPKLLSVEDQVVVNTEYGWKTLLSPHNGIKVMSVEDQEKQVCLHVSKCILVNGLIKRFFKDTFWGKLDYLICDTPPGTSDEHLTAIKVLKNVRPDGAIIVTTSQGVSIATVRREVNFCRKMGVKILGLVVNMSTFVCPCCDELTNIFPEDEIEKLSEEQKIPILARIPIDTRVTACCEVGRNPVIEHPNSQAIKCMEQLVRSLFNVYK
ncbi:Cytosolic Fe-S cluster assembly factor NUBP2 homolog,Cytosolic Fe-S cluster assembly factor nbp35,Cytosolic Fe-S cluster assembly factor nubp2,Cytosolic Fe-S cluster assembly factor nubp1,Cytosolic Fe-S cluster assembly factor NUBP2,Cytosolic Fe-S cluster assembly factor NUBP1,Cytosolic Fe-S cluster assembly factor NUBP1 homolog,Cytosolic Fe-S cluster assembly factor NUBP2 homolog 2,Cytosolic Fe-S cluster assembly factor nubp1-B,Cytosolic Fe-S cluster assembly factor nubp1-A,Cytosolic Fe-S cluster assembly|uniref:Cytosolic Fe-S cluster assembly factor NUBP1 homolog n=1 Tax=Mytilus coruscus TaxID=42192 RepID=A0A6J8C5M1_MYTCO|nr:Cytosolic Fe-S cluster assembly factor NUBP2 homolog,Cytosolic Fe-S cluster assembly factor nbp35,Cytosolic Fe-S cluster assembly factor nubp2,Cytosolic Fe-S cluster assembly factor nubp1,Cytosolic Fe-S cluster assembly factor NUBP2,Cytosolic Fe-S cluster assembly factor NUBP1,Cytosolic Fe-S cluster assembly factor NUBP1 homolog,Cytosolic Fe-S cluster assembly factor NUBP2 homolog 2,Cytosolic Fe-S cluster assembly factor nubp1-B,Cytosolic Fe-S cluster assembly factor nubp1-A,Cytosolic Fe-S clust